jgi:hypothetical protein
MKTNTKEIGGNEQSIRYKNKLTGELVLVPVDHKKYVINGKDFVQILDSKGRKLKMAMDSLEKIKP